MDLIFLRETRTLNFWYLFNELKLEAVLQVKTNNPIKQILIIVLFWVELIGIHILHIINESQL